MKIADPEKGVEIAKTLFDPERRNAISEDRVIYLSQNAKLVTKEGSKRVRARVDFTREEAAAHPAFFEEFA